MSPGLRPTTCSLSHMENSVPEVLDDQRTVCFTFGVEKVARRSYHVEVTISGSLYIVEDMHEANSRNTSPMCE